MSQNKRVCLINVRDYQDGEDTILAGERVMRTTRDFAERLIKETDGLWNYTSKSKLKSFLNKNRKLTYNMRFLEAIQQITGKTYGEKRERSSYGVKSYVIVPNFKYVHEKGENYSVETPVKGHQIHHSAHFKGKQYSKPYTQTITPKKFDRKGDKVVPVLELESRKRKSLFTKNQHLVATGEKKLIIAFP